MDAKTLSTARTLATLKALLAQEMPLHEVYAHMPTMDRFIMSYCLNHDQIALRIDPTQRDGKGEVVRYVKWVGI
jgi:hypothetical protein